MSTDVTVDVAYLINLEGQLAAINRSQAVIEFALDGTILTANDNFCNVLGYSLEEIRGRHHSMFVQARYRQSAAYRQFWEKLGGGQHDAGQYLRIGKHRREVWLQASYSPIHDRDGKAVKVVTYATDITTQRNNVVEVERILCEAIGRLPSDECEAFVGHLGGAVNRVPADATAYPHRDVEYIVNVHTRWREPGEDAKCIAWARGLFDALAPYATGGLKDNPPQSYDDVVRLQRERQERIEQYTRDLKRFYARYAELGEQKRVLLDQLMELTKASGPAQ